MTVATPSADATGRRIEDRLAEAEARYRDVVETQSDLICRFRPDTTLTFVNGAYCRFFGRTRDELIGTRFIDLLPDEVRPAVRRRVARQVARPRRDTYEHDVLLPDGTVGRQEWTDLPILDAEGRLIEIQGIGRDVTAQRRTEAALRQREREARELLAAAERRERELALLDRVRSALARELDLAALFRTVVEAVAEAFGYSQVSLYLLEGDELVLQHEVGYADVIERIPISQGVSGRVVRTGQPVLLEDVRTDPAFLGAIDGIASEVCVPLRDEGRAVGILNLESTRGARLGEDDLRLMVALSEHVGVAIGRARLYALARESEARFRAAFENAAIGMSLVSLDGRFLQVNRALCDIVGYTAEELRAKSFQEITHPDDLQPDLDQLRRLLAGEIAAFQMEKRYVRRDGRIVWVHLNVSLVRDDAGAPRYLVSQIEDISRRKAAEAALAAERDLLTALIDHLPDPVYVKDTGSRFVRLNRALARVFGLADPEAAIGKTDFDFFPESLARQYFADERRVMTTGVPILNKLEPQSEDADAGPWWLTSSVPLRDADGRVIGLIGTARDVTERRRLEEELRQSEARFRSLVANASDLITVVDADGTIRYESPPIARLLGYDPAALVGRGAFDLVHPDDLALVRAELAALLADPSRTPRVEFRFRHADGSWRWLESVGTNLLADPAVAGIVVNSRDVTERRRAEAELRAAKEAAEAANRAKGLFLSTAAHELRTPLTSVRGYAELLLAGSTDNLDDEQRDALRIVAASATRLGELVDALLDLSRIESGATNLSFAAVDLRDVVRQVLDEVGPQAKERGLTLVADLPPAPVVVDGDRLRLLQILLNLVGNAVKFTERGRVAVAARAVEDRVTVAVSDTGVGIAPEALPRIFDEFRQGDGTTARRFGGTGLGLAIAKRLAELHDGCITVATQPGVGSTFTLVLPARRPEPAAIAPDRRPG